MKKTNINVKNKFYYIISVLVFLSLSIYETSYAQDVGGVLVAAESSDVHKASVLEIRRIYLGLPSSPDISMKKPVVNLSNQKIYKAFLKNIMHMTEKGYKRKIIKRIFRQGGEKIHESTSIADLVYHLNKNIGDVSFMDKETAERTKGIKVVQVLW